MKAINKNVKMKHYQKYILIFLLLQSCSTTFNLKKNELDLKWKKEVMLQLSAKFVDYIKLRPRDPIHNYELDMYNKFIDLDRYPFGNGIQLLHKEVLKNKIQFDSIICVSTQSNGLNSEALNSDCYYLFQRDSLISSYYHDYLNNKIKKTDNEEFNIKVEYDRLISKIDGNSSSLLVFTKFDQKWNFEITKIVINNNDVW